MIDLPERRFMPTGMLTLGMCHRIQARLIHLRAAFQLVEAVEQEVVNGRVIQYPVRMESRDQ